MVAKKKRKAPARKNADDNLVQRIRENVKQLWAEICDPDPPG